MQRAAGILSACLSLLMAAGAGPMAASGRQAGPPAAQQASQQAPQPTFRTGVTIVPVDVRVLDRDGKPITDLKQSDFTVLEDGAAQDIRYFSARGLVPMPAPEETTPAIRTRSSAPLQEQSARIFLIVLGRGRLQYPSKGVDALLHLVRNRLLPQDQVAVLAFNRATDVTTDRARISQVLERYRRRRPPAARSTASRAPKSWRGARGRHSGTRLLHATSGGRCEPCRAREPRASRDRYDPDRRHRRRAIAA